MHFFEVLFWMGMLCFLPVFVVVIRDAMKAVPPSPEVRVVPQRTG